MARIVLDRVWKVFGSDVTAVQELSLDIEDGEFMVLVGPSGCGKSTILRLIAGLEEVTAGEIYVDDVQVTDLPPKGRDVAMVFQNYALYPHMTVEENIGFGLKIRGMSKEERAGRVADVTRVLKLEQLLSRKPAQLSGGQRQRVAMGRAIVREPRAFLMDEPLSNLDAKLRVQMRAELSRLHQRLGTTVLYVTHDQVEAMTLGDRVAVLKDGLIQQVDTPQSLFNHPANLFVAAFIGSPPMNLVEATVGSDTISFGGYEFPIPTAVDLAAYEGGSVILGIRPSDLEDAGIWKDDSLQTIEVVADVTEDLGSEVNVWFSVDTPPVVTDEVVAAISEESADALVPLISDRDRAVLCARVDARTVCRPGSPIRLTVDPDRFHVFDKGSGIAIPAPSG